MCKAGAMLMPSIFLAINLGWLGNSGLAQNALAPSPPQIGLPPSNQQDAPKVPLSWRLIAYGMTTDKTSAKKIKDQWTLAIPFERSYKTLNATLSQLGFTIVSAYPAAGQFLAQPVNAVNTSGSGQLVIVAKPVSDSETTFLLRIIGDTKTLDPRNTDQIPQVMTNLVQRGEDL